MTQPVIVGIDLGKNWFHLIGLDGAGAMVFRKKMNRPQLAQFAATAPKCIVATESCPGSQYWGRVFFFDSTYSRGDSRLITPCNDATAIASS